MLASALPCHAAVMFRPTPHERPAPIPAIDRRRLVLEMRRAALAARQHAQGGHAVVDALRASLRGEVIDPEHPAYNDARRVWNGLIDRYPAVIARCADVEDVVQAVRVAREQRPVLSIRAGGHQVAGSAVCDDGLVIDLSAMNAVEVDPTARIARVAAGATWGDVDRATQEFGLATTGGEVSATGVSGLTLGGGLGVTMRTFGLSCDNLRSIEIVTADGKARTASHDEHADLFWAARGGGRGLGVVTSFEFDLHPLGPEVASALVLYPYEDAEAVLRAWRDYARRAPDTVAPEIGLWSIPPLPDIPEDKHGAPVVIVAGVFIGAPEQSGPVLGPLRELGGPLADMSGTVPYVDSQSALDKLFPDGGRYYWKSHFLNELTDEAIRVLVEHDARRPSPESVIFIRTLGGAIALVQDDETAFAHRSASFNLSVDASWSDPELDDAASIEWARSTWEALKPFSTGGVYINFAGLNNDAAELRHALLGRNQERLDSIRRDYDPDGLFDAAALRQ
jgi:FAD/FMN-containing dehydrogenase